MLSFLLALKLQILNENDRKEPLVTCLCAKAEFWRYPYLKKTVYRTAAKFWAAGDHEKDIVLRGIDWYAEVPPGKQSRFILPEHSVAAQI